MSVPRRSLLASPSARSLLLFAALQLGACRAEPSEQHSSLRAGGPGAESSAATESDGVQSVSEPWLELMPSPSLEGFRRVPLEPLAKKAVWRPSADGRMLVIDGVGAKEMLLYESELGDGVLHVEWRFVPSKEPKPFYNGGVYVRTPLDGKHWVQLQVAALDKPPVSGDLIAQVPGVSERLDVLQAMPSAAHPVGEWNSYDIRVRGPVVELSVNGKHTVTWSECPMARGHVGLQAEGALIEVRSFKYQAL